MRRLKKIFVIIIIAIVTTIGLHVFYLTTLSADENYPDDTFFKSEVNKTALVIVAHDDDAISAAGTVCMLCQNGWTVKEMCFYGTDRERDSIRKISIRDVAAIQGVKEMKPIDCKMRIGKPEKEPWLPIPYAEFKTSFYVDSVNAYIGKFIEENKPSVIITLDDSIGGYGHPEHVLVSQQVMAYCKLHGTDSGFTVKKIYQAVFPPSMGERINKKIPAYAEGKKIYGVSGMPLPNIQINIENYASDKKRAMKAYVTEQKNLKKFWPYFHLYPAEIYFKIFNREFFKVIELSK